MKRKDENIDTGVVMKQPTIVPTPEPNVRVTISDLTGGCCSKKFLMIFSFKILMEF